MSVSLCSTNTIAGRLALLTIAVSAPLFGSACLKVSVRPGYHAQDQQLAATAVERFHTQFNAEQFEAIYDEADPRFRNGGTREATTAAMRMTKEKFGSAQKGIQVGANAFPGGEVRFIYNTQFENGDTTEAFAWQSDGKKAVLIHYEIFPGTVQPNTGGATSGSK